MLYYKGTIYSNALPSDPVSYLLAVSYFFLVTYCI